MKNLFFILWLLGSAYYTSFAQKPPKIASRALKLLNNMVLIPEGTMITSGGKDFGVCLQPAQFIQGHISFDSLHTVSEVPKRVVSIASFMIQSTEVTNLQWKQFYQAMVKKVGIEGAKVYLPDTSCWEKDMPYAYNDPLKKNYYQHIAYDYYPVVGISWQQAKAFCQWLTEEVNTYQREAGLSILPDFRLPTETEWEYAARGGKKDALLPLKDNKIINEKGQYTANFGNIRDKDDASIKSFVDDNFAYTSPVKSFTPNVWGLYDMAGNVAEWVEDVYRPIRIDGEDLNPLRRIDTLQHRVATDMIQESNLSDKLRVCKGGSWLSGVAHLYCSSRMAVSQEAQHSFLGFRVAMIILK